MLIPHHLNPPISREKDIQRYTPYISGIANWSTLAITKKQKQNVKLRPKWVLYPPPPPFPRKWERASSAASCCAFEGGGRGVQPASARGSDRRIAPLDPICPCYCKCYSSLREWHALHALFAAHSGHIPHFFFCIIDPKGTIRAAEPGGGGGRGGTQCPPKISNTPKVPFFSKWKVPFF